ncbi:MAG: hypothetical protein C0596_04760 [Marinilabiliales bacterium]|nr:MAG: hypothetical protein C0596_04760 [Marinilabiliales bacterium]
MKRLHIHFFKLSSYLFFPIMFGFVAIAEAFTVVLYSDKWLPSVPIFQVIAIASIAYFLGTLFAQTIMAKGDGKLYLRLNTTKKLIGLLSIPFGIFWGLYPFIISFVIFNFIGLLLDFVYTGRLINVKIITYLKGMLIPFLMSVVMAGLVYFGGEYLRFNYYLMLLVKLFAGVGLYILFSIIVKSKEFYYVKDVALEQIKIFLIKINLIKTKN